MSCLNTLKPPSEVLINSSFHSPETTQPESYWKAVVHTNLSVEAVASP